MKAIRALGVFSLTMLMVSYPASRPLAQPPGGSNFVSGRYPEMSCEMPLEPAPPTGNTLMEKDLFHEDIHDYNLKVDAYNECVKSYHNNSHNDIERIKKAVDDLIMIFVKNHAEKETFSEGSNLAGENSYPEMKCERPEKPREPISYDIYSKRVYERKMAQYDLDYEKFLQCADT
jgi:hypothetical protein